MNKRCELGKRAAQIIGFSRVGLLVACLTIVFPNFVCADSPSKDKADCYYVVQLLDGAMWVPCEFGVRVRKDPPPVLEMVSPTASSKPADLMREPRYSAVIYAGARDIADTRIGEQELSRLGNPTSHSLGRVRITNWPNAYGPFAPPRYVSLLTHGDAGVLVIASAPELVEQLAKSIHHNDQPVTPECLASIPSGATACGPQD
jgi:hypothetical protein